MISKEEMKKVIEWLEEYDDVIYLHRTPEDLDGLSEIVNKFKTYLKYGFYSRDVQQKIKDHLKETIQDSEENQEEINSEHRPECEDGSDEIIEALGDYASALLSQIEKWEKEDL